MENGDEFQCSNIRSYNIPTFVAVGTLFCTLDTGTKWLRGVSGVGMQG